MTDGDFSTIVFNEPGRRKLYVTANREAVTEALFGGLMPDMRTAGPQLSEDASIPSPEVHNPWLVRKSITPGGGTNYVEIKCFDPDLDQPGTGPSIRAICPLNVATVE
jgi:hypothetical protein